MYRNPVTEFRPKFTVIPVPEFVLKNENFVNDFTISGQTLQKWNVIMEHKLFFPITRDSAQSCLNHSETHLANV